MAKKLRKRDCPKRMVSLFAGIGGFELAFQSIGVKTTLMCEIDPIAQQVLKSNFPNTKLVGDICELEKLPRWTNVLCSGFPCQDISTIGEKKGMSGERSSLITEVFRLLSQTKVEWVVIENVPNMIHLHKGEIIKIIIEELERLGYKWAYRTIDSISFLPQHRCRVFVVASLNHNPNDVLLSNNVESTLGVVDNLNFNSPYGFYWTEGKYAIGLYKDAIPTLKCGSTIGIPSAPAILFPNGEIGCPDIKDAERLQGFPPNWTVSVEEITKSSARWKLVGNAVTVDVVSWIAHKILNPQKYDSTQDKEFKESSKWPAAAWGANGRKYVSNVSPYPIDREETPLNDFLIYPCKPLSLKAAKGFEHRLNIGTVHCPQYFRDAVHNYVQLKLNENG